MANLPEAVERWRPLVERYFRPEHADFALRMIGWESAGDPEAANPRSSARGLFQHLERLWPNRVTKVRSYYRRVGIELSDDIFDPETNIAAAAWLLDHSGKDPEWGGWGQWTPAHKHAPEDFDTPRFGDPNVSFPEGGYTNPQTRQERYDMDKSRWLLIQQRLQQLGYYKGDLDGLPGPETDLSIREFERNLAVEPRGVIGIGGPMDRRTLDHFTQEEINRIWGQSLQ